MTENPSVRALIQILEECQMFDDGIRRDSIWISGTYRGKAFTCEFNYPCISLIVQKKIEEIVSYTV